MINVLVVEDQHLVRDAIAALIDIEPDISVVGKCDNGRQAAEYLSQQPDIDIVLTDIEMPDMNGLELADYIKTSIKSSAERPIRTMIMTTFSKPGYIKRALALGVSGFVLKESGSQYLIDALRTVHRGMKVISPELAVMAVGDENPLSIKEMKALELASQGLNTSEIGKKLFLSEGTIRNYLSECISKLDATNRIDAARIAKQKGWL